ncbi:MAG: STAS domain-containing protein [Chloroflexi bacterium]|nr:STAS domain-containing protein [Chloroflexota bacterium]
MIQAGSPKLTHDLRKVVSSSAMTEHQTLTGDAPRPITPEPLRTVCTEDSTGAVVVHLTGDIDLGTAPALGACLISQLHNSPQCPVLVVDLAAVDFMSCAGLRILLDVQRRAAAHGITLRLTRCSRAVLRLLEVSGLHTQLQTYPTVQDALPWTAKR